MKRCMSPAERAALTMEVAVYRDARCRRPNSDLHIWWHRLNFQLRLRALGVDVHRGTWKSNEGR